MKRLVPALGLLVIAFVLVACSGANAAPSGPAKSADPNALQISSKDLKFSTDKLVAPAGKAFQIVYDNQEAAPHNVAIYRDQSASRRSSSRTRSAVRRRSSTTSPRLQPGATSSGATSTPT